MYASPVAEGLESEEEVLVRRARREYRVVVLGEFQDSIGHTATVERASGFVINTTKILII